MQKVKTYSSGKLDVAYVDIPNEIPFVNFAKFKGKDLAILIQQKIFSTQLGTTKYPPFAEIVYIDPNFEALVSQYFDEIVGLEKSRPDLAVGCTDFFFNNVCRLYWNLIASEKINLAIAFLKKICLVVDEWERKRNKKIHKGTPYYFLTFGFLQEGDIDSGFASMFKAIQEDKRSKDPILGKGAFKTSPAYIYASLIDDQKNYLYDAVVNLRKLLKKHIKKFNTQAARRFSIKYLDRRFLQNDDPNLEQIKFLFTYCLENVQKYLKQIPTLPRNDFHKIKNASLFFNLCLITDKILEAKYEQKFRNYVPRRSMTMGDGVALLFEDRGWIAALTPSQRKNPRNSLRINPKLPGNDPSQLIDQLFLNPIQFQCNNNPFNFEMRVMQLALKLRNYVGHNIRKQDVFVENFSQVVEWLFASIFIAVSTLPTPKKSQVKPGKPQAPKPTASAISMPTRTSSTVTVTSTTSSTPITSVPMTQAQGQEN